MAWTFGVGLGGMLVGAVAGIVPALMIGGVGYAALGLLGAVAGAGLGLWVALVRRRGWGWRELGFVSPRRSGWHLLWEVLVVGLVCTVLLGTTP